MYLNQDGSYNVAFIMNEAHRRTKLALARHGNFPYKLEFKHYLRKIWQDARISWERANPHKVKMVVVSEQAYQSMRQGD